MIRLILVLGIFLSAPCRAELTYLTVAGSGSVPLTVATAGEPENPAIVFIHGIGQSHYSFFKQLESDLADEFFLVTFDLRGHGASGKPYEPGAYTRSENWADDVAAVIAATGARRPVIVGWSYGTLVAMDYVRQFGTAGIAGISLTGALGALLPFAMPSADDDPNVAEFARLRELQMSPDPRDRVAASEGMVRFLTSAPVPAAEQQVLQAVTMMFPNYARQAMYSRPQDNQDLLDKLTVPVFLQLGADDNPAMLIDAADLVAGRPNFSLSVYEGAGHSVFYEQPERFNAELRQFAKAAQQSVANPQE
ncbi:MAG: alpha/beta hydrolase [Gammaproteobacteria bacterium]|jgi:pimeloyl-ACP methyl ester carboxylesterase|nr:alpha/beta hydrolase [Gammaproteobacteria bacterium]